MQSHSTIDLNADVGEGCGDDAALIPLVSSCNIACGAHAGDETTMQSAITLALQHNVAIGAHPGYADRINFGRIVVPLATNALFALVTEQLVTLAALVTTHGGRLRHVKPHGALYNLAAHDLEVATTIADAVARFDSSVSLVGLANSALITAGVKRGLQTLPEAFIDRAYTADGSLRDRRLIGAVHGDLGLTLAQALALANHQPIQAFDGIWITINARTLCIHGDTPNAVAVAQAVRKALHAANVSITQPER